MPARTDGSISTDTYLSSLTIPADVISVMKSDPRSNIIFTKIQKYRSNGVGRLHSDELWIVCKTTRSNSRGGEDVTIDFVLGCAYGVIGNYPIFIYGTKLEEELSSDYLELRMMNVVHELCRTADPRRVYSIFAVQPVARSFAAHWSHATKIGIVEEPYYDAKFSFCTAATLTGAPPRDPSAVMRVARDGDLEQVAQLCREFAADSPPFVLSAERARTEASVMIQAGQVWVLEVQHSRGSSIACIVCLTRPSETVSAITKVFTPRVWRRRGYAFRLVREVCNYLFTNVNERKDYVVLYVGHGNRAADVYSRVGFVGLEPGTQSQYGLVENWLELGFDRTKVVLGHW